MTEAVRIGEVDVVGESEFRELAERRKGPCVSILIPTHRAGPETRQDLIRLRNRLTTARDDLVRAGIAPSGADELLAPWRALLDDQEFWQFQADGLALFAAPGFHRRYRVPLDLPEEATVGTRFRLRPLLPLATGDGLSFVLALSQNQVRLYQTTRSSIAEIALGSTPTSMAEALRYEDPEHQLQFRSSGGDTAHFHGHGVGGEVDKQALERFFRAVDRGLGVILGRDPHPLVLAAVAYYAPIYRSVSRHPRIVDGCVEGNPERRTLEDLHAAAWPLAEPALEAGKVRALERYRRAPAARVATDAADVLTAAREGRVDTLFVTAEPPIPANAYNHDPAAADREGDSDTQDVADRAVTDAFQTGAAVYAVEPSVFGSSTDMAALLRF